jgi:hypothetical protein
MFRKPIQRRSHTKAHRPLYVERLEDRTLLSTTPWTEEAKLTPSDAAAGDFFGYPVSIFGDTIVVGAYLDDDAGSSSGSAYVFATVKDPVEMIAALIDKVTDLNLQQGIENSLDVKLDAALAALVDVNQNNNVAAIGSLNALINAIEFQRGNKISVEQADDLIADILRIIELLEEDLGM